MLLLSHIETVSDNQKIDVDRAFSVSYFYGSLSKRNLECKIGKKWARLWVLNKRRFQ